MLEINGSKWYKVDFHMHTDASSDYRDENYTHRSWLLKCMEKELDCVVISDHNTGKNIDFIKDEYSQIKEENLHNFRELTILPSIELTVNGGVHLLVIFPEDTESKKISSFLGAVGIYSNEGDIEAITTKSLLDILDITNKSEYKTLCIPAHVDEIKGLFTEEHGLTLKNICLKENIFAIEQINKNFLQPQIYKELNLKHHRVIGSDSHKLDDIGRRFTFVKMGLPNFDGLKVALSDKLNKNIFCSDEININPNEIRWDFISELSIKNAFRIGRGDNPLTIKFSPWLNTIIGGRGSGKSSIIKMLQFAYGGNEDLKSEHPDKKDFFKVGNRNSSGMLLNDIEVDFKYLKTDEETLFKKTIEKYYRFENGNFNEIDYKVIQQFYPLTIITQKELFEKASHPEEIFSLIDSKIDYYSWEMDFNRMIKSYEESKSIERNLQQDIRDRNKIEEQLKDTNSKLKTYEKYDFSELLKNHAQFKNESMKLRKIYDEINILKDVIKNININIDFSEIDFLNNTTPDIQNIDNKIKTIKETIEKQIEDLDNIAKEWVVIWKESKWNENQNIVKIKFDSLSEELKLQGTDITEYNKALDNKEDLSKKIYEIIQKETLLSEQIIKSNKILIDINNKRKELYKNRKDYIDTINSNLESLFKNTRVQFTIEYLGDILGSEQEFRRIIQRQDSTFESKILLVDDSSTENSGFLWNLQLSDSKEEKLEELKRNILLPNEEYITKFGAKLSTHFSSIYQNKANEDALITWFPKDKLSMKIISNNRTLDVNSASAGQKAAALMTYILLETKGPLIIDQPEDDLDSRMITDLIVDSLRQLKEKRQVIVVTHNPNIPVNAASEKIFEMNFVNGQILIKEEGSIQESNIRDSICQVMEGGEDALEHRFNKIIKYK